MSRRRARSPKSRGPRPSAPPPIEAKRSGDFYARRITGAASSKTYTCPACHQPIRPATPHVVAWPVEKALLSDSALDERRHWHTTCWKREP